MKSKMDPIKFRLLNIETKQFAIIPESYDSKAEHFQFSFGINFSFPDQENRLVSASCLAKYQKEESPFLILEIAVLFEIEMNSWNSLLDLATESIRLPKSTAHHMMSLLVGITRGALHAKTEHTEFNKFVLPTINLAKIVDGDISHSFKRNEKEL